MGIVEGTCHKVGVLGDRQAGTTNLEAESD